MTHTSATRSPRSSSSTSDAVVTSLRIAAVLSVVVLLWQFVTAGSLLGPAGSEGAESLHATGAIVLHVVTGLTAIAAGLAWRLRGAPVWPAVVAAVVFVLSFVQAYYGGGQTLWIHVPGAMVLTIGSVVVAAWSFTRVSRG